MSHDTGGPAFPRLGLKVKEPDGTVVPHEPGMTLRDYFAAKAMQVSLRNVPPYEFDTPFSEYAEDAYAMADAMLEARKA